MTFEEFKKKINEISSDDEYWEELKRSVMEPDVSPITSDSEIKNSLTVSYMIANYTIKKRATEAAGIETEGFESVLRTLASFRKDASINIFSFNTGKYHFVTIIDMESEEPMAWLRVRRRDDSKQ